MLELLLAKPGPMPLGPVLAAEVAAAVAVQAIDHAMPPPQAVAPDRLAAPRKISDRLLGLVGDMDGGQLAGPEQPDQLSSIPVVGLDALTRVPGGATPGRSPGRASRFNRSIRRRSSLGSFGISRSSGLALLATGSQRRSSACCHRARQTLTGLLSHVALFLT
jgi:hypothetical protein